MIFFNILYFLTRTCWKSPPLITVLGKTLYVSIKTRIFSGLFGTSQNSRMTKRFFFRFVKFQVEANVYEC